MAEVEEVEVGDSLGEMLFGGWPVVIIRAMDLMKMMSLSLIVDVVRLFEVV
jgi:hypothetical protein